MYHTHHRSYGAFAGILASGIACLALVRLATAQDHPLSPKGEDMAPSLHMPQTLTLIVPHTHPKMERLTILSGTFRLGMDETFNPEKMQDLTAVTFGFWPAGMKHYAMAKGATIVQLHGIGPWQIVYLNLVDAPWSNKK